MKTCCFHLFWLKRFDFSARFIIRIHIYLQSIMAQNVCKTAGQKRSIEDTVPPPNESNKGESSGSDHVRAPNPLRRRNSLTGIPSLMNQQNVTTFHKGKTFNLNQTAVCTQPVLACITRIPHR